MPLYDVSRTLSPSMFVWPGDTPFQAEQVGAISATSPVNIFRLHFTVHTSTHIDAFYHYTTDGLRAHEMPLDPYIGPARLLTVEKRSGPLNVEDFPAGSLTGIQRLLVRSYASDLPDNQWPGQFVYPSPEFVAYLASQGCVLIGLDSPSFDDPDSKTLPGHQALYQHKICNIETMRFVGMPDGDYELIALPLKIEGVCGSPVRAVLRS